MMVATGLTLQHFLRLAEVGDCHSFRSRAERNWKTFLQKQYTRHGTFKTWFKTYTNLHGD